MDDSELQTASTDAIERELTDGETLIARIRARQLVLLREVDRRQVPLADGCRSLTEWATGRLDVAPETAAALARTAKATADLPGVFAVLATGEVTFDRAVEVSRTATPATEAEVLEDAWGLDVAGVRRLAARLRRFTRRDEHVVFGHREFTIQPNLDESTWRLWGLLPGFAGRIVDKAITERADTLPRLPDGTYDPYRRRRADALVAMAQDSLTGTTGDGEDTTTVLATVFVDATVAARTNGEAGVVVEAGPRAGPEALDAIMCDGTVEVTAVTSQGVPLGGGTTSRVIPPRLRRFVLARDGGCTADGCTSRYRLQVHHRIPASLGGATDADNLTTLCWFHHHVVVHGYGYRIDPTSPPQRQRFLRPGRPPPDHDPP